MLLAIQRTEMTTPTDHKNYKLSNKDFLKEIGFIYIIYIQINLVKCKINLITNNDWKRIEASYSIYQAIQNILRIIKSLTSEVVSYNLRDANCAISEFLKL